jgi:hypothetical protein
MLVVRSPLWESSSATNRTTAGEYETRPWPKVTSTVVGRPLRRVTVRFPTERSVAGHPSSVVSVMVSQVFVTVALRVTRNAARLGCDAASAELARNASRQTRTVPPVMLK